MKMKAQDGKYRETDTLDTKGIFRLIESVPSPKAEPFKLWLVNLGEVAKDTLEQQLGRTIIDKDNNLNYKYITKK